MKKYNLPDLKTTSNHDLWQICLTPTEERMPKEIKEYIEKANKEFHKRKIKLVPIMDCKYPLTK